jgi:hypothetical protein
VCVCVCVCVRACMRACVRGWVEMLRGQGVTEDYVIRDFSGRVCVGANVYIERDCTL